MRARIEIPSSGTIDLYEESAMPITYSIADIRNPWARNASYSKTITAPGTKNNNKLFGHIYEIGINGTFNPNRKTDAVVYSGQLSQLKGRLQLLQVDNTDDNKIEYQLSIFGKIDNIFSNLGDEELTDLDFSEYDHTYNRTNQKNSWDTSIIKNGSTYVNFSGGNPTGEGYVYPLIDFGYTNGTSYDVEHFFPAVYLKTYIDKVFDYAGFTYDSSFFNSSFFKRLVIPCSNVPDLPASSITERSFRASITSNQDNLSASTFTTNRVNFDDDSTSPNGDPLSQYSTVAYEFTATNPGIYNFVCAGSTSIRYEPSAPSYIFLGTATTVVNVMVQRVWSQIITLGSQSFLTPAQSGIINPGDVSTAVTFSVSSGDVEFFAGDKVYVEVVHKTNAYWTYYDAPGGNVVAGDTYVRINAGTEFYGVARSKIVEGDTFTLNSAIPQKVKIKDFLTSIIRMFNLYIEEDRYVSNKLYIEPRDDFYSSGTVIDWTAKLDVSQKLEIKPMGELDAKQYYFTYTPDKDYHNEQYTKRFNEVYGEELIDIDNDFLKDKKETKVIFSPTPLVQYPTSSDRIIPMIVSLDSNNAYVQKESNIRLLYYGGVKSTTQSWTYITNGATYTETSYPYAGHLDDPSSPTLDLNFGVVRQVFYNATAYTDNNLYNAYHKSLIEEISDKDSKIVTGYFRLRPMDIYSLDFRNTYYVDGHHLRLNKIYDYDPTKEELTKCEFIKIKKANRFTATTTTINGGTGVTVGGKPSPSFAGDVSRVGNNSFNALFAQVIGRDNYVDPTSTGVFVNGDSNRVGMFCSNISLVNTSGCIVYGGLSNVSLVNSSGLTVTESNVTYTNGYKVSQESIMQSVVVDISSSEFLNLNSVPKDAISSPGDGKYIDVIDAIGKYSYGGTPYTGSAMEIRYADGTSILRFGASLTTSTANAVQKRAAGSVDNPPVNYPVQITVLGGNPSGGNGSYRVEIFYRIVTI